MAVKKGEQSRGLATPQQIVSRNATKTDRVTTLNHSVERFFIALGKSTKSQVYYPSQQRNQKKAAHGRDGSG